LKLLLFIIIEIYSFNERFIQKVRNTWKKKKRRVMVCWAYALNQALTMAGRRVIKIKTTKSPMTDLVCHLHDTSSALSVVCLFYVIAFIRFSVNALLTNPSRYCSMYQYFISFCWWIILHYRYTCIVHPSAYEHLGYSWVLAFMYEILCICYYFMQ